MALARFDFMKRNVVLNQTIKKHALNSTSIYVFCQEKMASPSGDRLDVEDYVLDEIFSEWGDSPPNADSDNGR